MKALIKKLSCSIKVYSFRSLEVSCWYSLRKYASLEFYVLEKFIITFLDLRPKTLDLCTVYIYQNFP